MQDKLTALIEKYGAFYALGQKQFNEKKQVGVEYSHIFAGLMCPKSNVDAFLADFKALSVEMAQEKKERLQQRKERMQQREEHRAPIVSRMKERARIKAQNYRKWADANEAKANKIHEDWRKVYGSFDWTQPILRGHHSQRAHERVYERRDAMHRKVAELYEKAKRMREKATNLEHFANTNKGDAEARRQAVRDANDASITKGATVHDACFGAGVVVRVNKKTYSIQFKSGSVYARDKSFVALAN